MLCGILYYFENMQNVIARIYSRLGIVLVQYVNLIKFCSSEQFIALGFNQDIRSSFDKNESLLLRSKQCMRFSNRDSFAYSVNQCLCTHSNSPVTTEEKERDIHEAVSIV